MAREEYRELLVALVGGLNTSADPAEIENDELAEATGMEYRPPNVGLFNTAGRTSFGTWTAGGERMHGLVYAQFEILRFPVFADKLEGQRFLNDGCSFLAERVQSLYQLILECSD